MTEHICEVPLRNPGPFVQMSIDFPAVQCNSADCRLVTRKNLRVTETQIANKAYKKSQ